MNDISTRPYSLNPKFVIVTLMVFAGLFSIFFMLRQSLGLDEAQSLWQSAHDPGGILYVVAQDVHVPLYHFLLHYWQIAFGNSTAAARSLSLVFYLATIPLVYKMGKIAFDERTALFGVIIFALSPFTNWYGSIIRMYSQLAFFTVLNQIFFLLIYRGAPERRKRYWIGYFISGLLGIYTHYFFVFVLLVQAGFFFTHKQLFPKGSQNRFIAIAVMLSLLLLPWLWYVRSMGGLGANTSPRLLAPSTVDIANTFSNFFFGFQMNAVNTVILSLWPVITLLFMVALQRNKRVTPEATYFIVTTLAPILGAATLSNFITPFYLSRYFIGIFPSCCLAASWFFSLYPQRTATFTRIALAGLMIVTLGVQTVTADASSPIKEDYQGVADYVAGHATARDIVAVSTPFTIYPFEYYYRGTAAITTIPYWNRLVTGPIPQYSPATLSSTIDSFKNNHEYLYLVLSYDQGNEEAERLYFDTHFERVYDQEFSPDLTLYVYRLNYANTSISQVMATGGTTPSGITPSASPSSTSL